MNELLLRRSNLHFRAEAKGIALNKSTSKELLAAEKDESPTAVIIGFGPVGKTASRILRSFGFTTVIIDLNLDTVRQLLDDGQLAVYGDATRRDILESAGVRTAKYLLITVPEVMSRTVVIMTAHELNPTMKVIARARYISELAWLAEVGATDVVTEEAETALALATKLLLEVGADSARIKDELDRIRAEITSSGFRTL